MIKAKYQFIGKPDRVFPKLKTGKNYHLTIVEEPKGFLNWLWGIKRPIIIDPITCPYDSWRTFRYNWRKISQWSRS